MNRKKMFITKYIVQIISGITFGISFCCFFILWVFSLPMSFLLLLIVPIYSCMVMAILYGFYLGTDRYFQKNYITAVRLENMDKAAMKEYVLKYISKILITMAILFFSSLYLMMVKLDLHESIINLIYVMSNPFICTLLLFDFYKRIDRYFFENYYTQNTKNEIPKPDNKKFAFSIILIIVSVIIHMTIIFIIIYPIHHLPIITKMLVFVLGSSLAILLNIVGWFSQKEVIYIK